MFKRLLKVLIIISFFIVIATITIDAVYFIRGDSDVTIGYLIGTITMSFFPMLLITIIQYVVYGSMHPLYTFKKQ